MDVHRARVNSADPWPRGTQKVPRASYHLESSHGRRATAPSRHSEFSAVKPLRLPASARSAPGSNAMRVCNFLLLMAFGTASASRATEVAGRILDARSGTPIRAEVRLVVPPSGDPELWAEGQWLPAIATTVMSDSGGSFRLELPDTGGPFAIYAVAPGYAAAWAESLVSTRSRRTRVDLRLQPGGSLQGNVAMFDGEPVAGAMVSVHTTRFRPPVQEPVVVAWAHTNEDGSFRLDGLGTDPAVLLVRDPKGAWTARQGVVPGKLSIQLGGGNVVRGQVTGSGGEPVSGAVVAASLPRLGRGLAVLPVSAARTDVAGRFELAGVPSAEIALTTFSLTHAPSSWTGRAPLNPEPTIHLEAGRGARLVMNISSARDGTPVSDALVHLAYLPLRGRTDSAGRVILSGLGPGTVVTSVQAPGFQPWFSEPQVLRAGAETQVSATLVPEAIVSGRVIDEKGLPVLGATVSGSPLGVDASGSRTFTDARGVFELAGLPPEPLALTVASGHRRASLRLKRLAPGEERRELQVTLKPGAVLQGLVVGPDGTGVPNADVWASLPEESVPMNSHDVLSRTVTGPHGAFQLTGLPVGQLRVLSDAPGYVASRGFPVVSLPGQVTLVPSVELRPGVILRAKVVSGDKPIEGATARILSTGASALSRADGTLAIEDVDPEAALQLLVTADGFQPTQRSGVVAGRGSVTLALRPAVRMRGVVVDAGDGEPVRTFQVQWTTAKGGAGRRLYRSGRPQRIVSKDGSFELLDLSPGRVDLSLQAPGYQDTLVMGVEVPEAPVAREAVVITVRLERGLVLQGTVRDENRAAVIGATIRVEAPPGSTAPRHLSRSPRARTDTAGRFQVEGLRPGVQILRASVERKPDSVMEVDLQPGMDEVTIVMARGRTLTGEVIRRDARPAAGAVVTMEGTGRSIFSRTEVTNDAGEFSFDGLAEGTYRVRAVVSSGARSAETTLTVGASDPASITLQISPGASIEGIVQGATERELRAFGVYAVQGTELLDGVPRSDGSFEVGNILPGEVALFLELGAPAEGREISRHVVMPEGEERLTIEIEVGSGSDIEGVVSRGGRPLPGARVQARPVHGSIVESSVTTTTDRDGLFRLPGLTDGDYELGVFHADSGASAVRRVSVDGNKEVDIEIPEGRVAGRVLDANSGEGVAAAGVLLQQQSVLGDSTSLRTQTDGTGAFALEAVPDGEFLLRVSAVGYADGSERLTLSAERSVEDVELALSPEEALHLLVQDLRTGLAPQQVLVFLVQGEELLRSFPLHGVEGHFLVPSLEAGSVSLLVTGDGSAPVNLPQVQVPGEVSVSLQEGGSIAVRLSEGAGSARLRRADGAFEWWPDRWSYRVRLDARVEAPSTTLGPVIPGSYQLILSIGEDTRTYPVTIANGEVSTVDVE